MDDASGILAFIRSRRSSCAQPLRTSQSTCVLLIHVQVEPSSTAAAVCLCGGLAPHVSRLGGVSSISAVLLTLLRGGREGNGLLVLSLPVPSRRPGAGPTRALGVGTEFELELWERLKTERLRRA